MKPIWAEEDVNFVRDGMIRLGKGFAPPLSFSISKVQQRYSFLVRLRTRRSLRNTRISISLYEAFLKKNTWRLRDDWKIF